MTLWNSTEQPGFLSVLVEHLVEMQSLRDPATRRLCLDMIADRLGVELVVEELPTPRSHLLGIVRACLRQHPRALNALVDVLEMMEPRSLPVQRARAAVDELVTLEIVAEPDRRELLTLLAGGAAGRLTELVRAAVGPAVELATGFRGPSEALATLERLNARPDGMPPLLVFVEYLATCLGDDRSEQLRRWNDRQAARMGLTEKVLTVRQEQAPGPVTPQDVTAYLVIRLETDLLDADQLTVAHWRQSDPGSWRPRRGEPFSGDLEAVRGHVAELVAEAEADWAKDAQAIRIEFLLPYALLNLPVDQWDLEPESALPRPVGLHYEVVLRSLDRARAPRWHREWRRRWELFKRAAAAGPTTESHWLWSDGAKPRQLATLDAKLAVQREVVSVVLRSTPDAAGVGEVMVGVRGGVPVMLWQRGEAARPAFEAEVKAMLGTLPELADRLRLLRSRARQAARPDAHVGSRVSLLWDDPDCPVEPQDPPAAPSEEMPA